jgi:hypothetical protein
VSSKTIVVFSLLGSLHDVGKPKKVKTARIRASFRIL